MAQTYFQKVKACNQRDKDIVYGYIKRIQSILPHEQNSYFIIVQLIQNWILLYFHNRIDTELLTDDEQNKLFKLFEDNTKDKFIHLLRNKSLKLIFKSSGYEMDAEKCIDKVYDKKHILILIHSSNDNICGGYTSVGWKKKLQNAGSDKWIKDEDAFLFSIRSKGYEPRIAYIKKENETKAIRHYWNNDAYLMFGSLELYVYRDTTLFAEGNSCYQPFPFPHYLLGGGYSDSLKEIEIFQFD